ncbi:MAG TPA: lysine--tRNA ligase [Thermoanaerobaculia bacterium]|jgi:lysyl-tRNA synthetase class 2
MYENAHPLVSERLRKVQELRDLGIDPYPQAAYPPTHTLAAIRRSADVLAADGARVRIAGRILARREMGKVVFLDLLDDGARLQVYCSRPDLGERAWRVLDLLDLGDFVGVEGPVFYTRSGELSVQVESMTVLGKASHPIPLPKQQGERAFGAVSDRGTLYRHRHVDLVANPASREVFLTRSRVIRGIRRYLDEEGFVEVETPVLGQAYSGAVARPFVTTVNALDQTMYLRISPECALKRLLCGGLNKVYEIGKSFRNEGIDASHNPEFTMVEWYEAYSDYLHQMQRFETLVARLCEEVHGTTRITRQGRPLDLTPPWRRLPMLEGLREIAGLDLDPVAPEGMPEVFRRHHPAGVVALPEPLTWDGALVELFEALVEPHLWDPVFVMDHPVEVSPLTKRHRTDPRLVERFEPIIAGMEVGNSYSELNDPLEQYQRLVSQQVAREDAYDLDEDFLQAVAHGMPPAGGTGLGVDRVVMILTDARSLRDVILFPLVTRRSNGAADLKGELAVA